MALRQGRSAARRSRSRARSSWSCSEAGRSVGDGRARPSPDVVDPEEPSDLVRIAARGGATGP